MAYGLFLKQPGECSPPGECRNEWAWRDQEIITESSSGPTPLFPSVCFQAGTAGSVSAGRGEVHSPVALRSAKSSLPGGLRCVPEADSEPCVWKQLLTRTHALDEAGSPCLSSAWTFPPLIPEEERLLHAVCGFTGLP